VQAFNERAVKGISANPKKAEAWLAKNASIVTALNPLIGYVQGAALVKEAFNRDMTIRQVALEKARAGLLRHREQDRAVSAEEIEAALDNLRKLTEGGIL
jgi:fumarate hydratase class II